MKKLAIFFLGAAVLSTAMTSCGSSKKVETDTDSLNVAIGILIGSYLEQNMAQIPGGKAKVDSIIKGFEAGFDKEQSYAIGMQQAMQAVMELKARDLEPNKAVLVDAFKRSLKGDSTMIMTQEQAMEYFRSYQSPAQKEAQEAAQKEAVANIEAGKTFLANKEKEAGIVKTASGLLYKVEKEGKGKKAAMGDAVLVNYKGTLMDGTEFDNSQRQGGPVTFTVGQLVPGFNEALQLMSPGSKLTVYIPSELGYGDRQMNEVLKANSTLIFEIEMVDFAK